MKKYINKINEQNRLNSIANDLDKIIENKIALFESTINKIAENTINKIYRYNNNKYTEQIIQNINNNEGIQEKINIIAELMLGMNPTFGTTRKSDINKSYPSSKQLIRNLLNSIFL